MPQECIEIRSAHESNVKHVSLRIPKRNITNVSGMSGSRKSSMYLSLWRQKRSAWLTDVSQILAFFDSHRPHAASLEPNE